MTVEFRYARPGDYASVAKFLDRYWAKDYIYVRKPELFEWTFRRSIWDQDGYSFALVEDKGEIAGILGAIPFLFNSLGKSSRAVWFANLMVRPEYRRGPVAIQLLGMFRRAPYVVNAVAGINSRAVSLYQRLHWKLLGAIPRNFAVFPPAIKRMVHLLRLTHPEWPADRAESLTHYFVAKNFSGTPVQRLHGLPPTWDSDDWPKIASETIGAARDCDFLTWRYLKHPCFKYRLQTLAEGTRTGMAVWRIEPIHVSTPRGPEEVDRIGRLVEFLPVSLNNARNLLLQFWTDLYEADALGADYYGYHAETRAWFRELGFAGTEEHPDGVQIPSRFQPLDCRGGSPDRRVHASGSTGLFQ